MRKILHVVVSLDNEMGGIVHAALNTCRMLVDRSVDVEVVATTGRGDDLGHLRTKYANVNSHLFERTFPRHYFNSSALRRWLRINVPRYELIHIHGIFSFPTLYAARAAIQHEVPYVLQPHGSLDPWDLQKHSVLKRIYGPAVLRPLFEESAAILLTSRVESDRVELYGANPERLVVPLAVEFDIPHGLDKNEVRDELFIPRDAEVVLFLGRFDYKKGLQFLVPALAELKRSHPKLWFLLSGSGTPEEERVVEALLNRYSVRPWTTVTGFVSGRRKEFVYAASDFFALPSLNENFGITVIEALRAGLASVISSEVYISSILEAERAAIICEPSIESCVDSLTTVLSDFARSREMRNRGSSVAESHFSTQAAFDSLINVYKNLASRRG